MVTAFDVAPPIEITTGTAAPLDDRAGISAFTWYSPTDPGARPENRTEARSPPIVKIAVVSVDERGRPASQPVGGGLVTGPRPVQNIWITVLPATAGFAESTRRLEASRIAPWPVPWPFMLKIPGENGARFMVSAELVCPFTVTERDVCNCPASSQ